MKTEINLGFGEKGTKESELIFVDDDAYFKHQRAYNSVKTLTLKNGTLTLFVESWSNGETENSSCRAGVKKGEVEYITSLINGAFDGPLYVRKECIKYLMHLYFNIEVSQ